MSRPAYYGRPAMVARYHRHGAPASVQVVAMFQYLGAVLSLAVAALAAGIERGVVPEGRGGPLDRVPAGVRQGLTGGGLVIAVTLAVLGLLWLLVARGLQRGRAWARTTVVAVGVLAAAGTGYDFWVGRRPDVLAGLALPVLYLVLLSTRAARAWFRYGTW